MIQPLYGGRRRIFQLAMEAGLRDLQKAGMEGDIEVGQREAEEGWLIRV